MKTKKGISPLIATVLIIGFTIVVAAMVIVWGTDLFKKTVSETETVSQLSKACSSTNIEVLSYKLNPDKTVDMTLKNNNQDYPLKDFKVVLNYKEN